MPSTSQYLQISDYALVEYVYADENITTTQARCLRLQNKYTNTYQFLNNAQAYKKTGNILDKSASKLGTDSQAWAYHDIDVVVPTIQTDANFVLEDVTASLLSNQYYDTIRLHLLAGFTFPGLDGLVLEVIFNEWTATGLNSRPFTAAANVFLKSEPGVTFATDPIFIADRYFDRFIEIKVPSLFQVNQDFWTSPTASNTFGYQYTFNNVGFFPGSQIGVNVYEINFIEERNGNRFLRTGTTYNGTFNQQDEYSFVGAVIKENAENDYIEYYPTYQGGFIEDYINLLNSTGSWVVINQLTVYEQVGTQFVKTSDVTILQEENFDQPSVYRPIIRNAPAVFSYEIEYIMRLLNKVSNQEIVRRSSFSSTEVKKYGLQLEKINALEGFRPIKVYNKIVKNDETPSPGISFGAPRFITQYSYINNYFDVNYISVDSTTDVSSEIGQTVYPQGKNIFFMNPFDNYVKFKIFTKSKDKKQNVTIDLASTGMNIKLSFVYDDKSQVFVEPVQDIEAANPGAGEVLFRIDSDVSIKLLGGKTRNYFLVNRTVEGDDVLIYSGKFEDVALRDTSQAVIDQNTEIVNQLNEKIATLQKLQEATSNGSANGNGTTAAVVTAATESTTSTLVTTNEQGAQTQVTTVTSTDSAGNTRVEVVTTSPATELEKQADEKAAAQSQEMTLVVTKETAAVENAIVKEAGTIKKDFTKTLNIPEVPGVTPPVSKANWTVIKPVVQNPSGQPIPASDIIKNQGRGGKTGTSTGAPSPPPGGSGFITSTE